ncbi:secretory carrier-associated membrane protein 2-like [Eucyclogobius newberryi]|uniref:secretory carrier-associated membrane protein 2-like n=1 Tax=Eucyclogobius newberryi TaxID=166745 RepID=UPI003B58C040
MSGIDTNPFSAATGVNPFEDPSVTQVMNSTVTSGQQQGPFPNETAGFTSPAVLQPTTEPAPKEVAAAAQADLLRRQEELEKKAAELERREEEINDRNRTQPGVKENNWPPLPRFCPVRPCFYQNFSEEIPPEHQRVCKMMYYLCMLNSLTLFLNVLACLALFTTASTYGQDFGLSLVWFLLFTPCSFLCWYRPMYKAFRTDSSFSFFFFFFVFFVQVAIFIIQSVGIPGWGNSGWLTTFSAMSSDKVVGGVLMVVAVLFTLCAVLSVVLLKMVHGSYRRTGASFHKAQQEFSQEVLSNKNVQNAASSAAQSALHQNN